MRRKKKTGNARPQPISPYREMWLLVMFDLPVVTHEGRKEYRKFRERLLRGGFLQLQYSVYARPCPSDENAQVHRERVKKHLPPAGSVRMVMMTDKQFERMENFLGKTEVPSEKQPEQLTFF